MALIKVDRRGRVTLPQQVCQEAQISPGDMLSIFVISPGLLTVEVVPRLDIDDFFEAYAIDGPVDVDALRRDWETEAVHRVIAEIG